MNKRENMGKLGRTGKATKPKSNNALRSREVKWLFRYPTGPTFRDRPIVRRNECVRQVLYRYLQSVLHTAFGNVASLTGSPNRF